MKEYIERDLAIKALEKSLELVQNTEVHEEENDYKAGAIDARRDDISNIKSLPVAKVNMNELELLKAKQAIFKMIGQFHRPTKMFDNDDTLYIYNYCESALEAAFNVLNIEENYIPLMDFCKMWEDNDRAIWNIYNPDDDYKGITADIHYKVFVENYEARLRWVEEEYDN